MLQEAFQIKLHKVTEHLNRSYDQNHILSLLNFKLSWMPLSYVLTNKILEKYFMLHDNICLTFTSYSIYFFQMNAMLTALKMLYYITLSCIHDIVRRLLLLQCLAYFLVTSMKCNRILYPFAFSLDNILTGVN